ncbi:MAG: hypothetical protein R2710_19150 [Acidimicrobiales bacterium]
MTHPLSPEEADAFRERCRAFLAEHATGLKIEGDDPRSDQSVAQAKAFQAKVAEARTGRTHLRHRVRRPGPPPPPTIGSGVRNMHVCPT